jgi:sulfur dioxygenase
MDSHRLFSHVFRLASGRRIFQYIMHGDITFRFSRIDLSRAVTFLTPVRAVFRRNTAGGEIMIMESLHLHACKSYLLADGEEGFAALIDPVLEHFGDYLNLIRKRRFTLTHVIDTHTHADHISAGAALKDALRCAYVMHEKASSACVNEPVRDGDVLHVGKLRVAVLHMPGHTPDSICLKAGQVFFTGDFLFLDDAGAGRDDLPGGDAGMHWESLQKTMDLPDSLIVHPAHEYHGRKPSTLGRQRHTNPHLKARTREEFIRYINEVRLVPKEWMKMEIRSNQASAMNPRSSWIPADLAACEIQGTMDVNVNTLSVDQIEASALKEMLDSRRNRRHAQGLAGTGGSAVLLLDVREPPELDSPEGQISGVVNMPIGQLPRRLGELDKFRDKPVITICHSGSRAATVARMLTASGFRSVQVLGGGMHAWNKLRF